MPGTFWTAAIAAMLSLPLVLAATEPPDSPPGAPSDAVQTPPDQPESGGAVLPHADRYVIGVGVEILQQGVHQLLGVEEGTGLLVMRVIPNGPAARAGVAQHDLILSINGTAATAPNELVRIINQESGQPIQLKLRRGSETLELEVVPERAGPGLAMIMERLPFPPSANSTPHERLPVSPEALEFDLVGPGMLPGANDDSIQFAELQRQIEALRQQQIQMAEQLQQVIDCLRPEVPPKEDR